MTFVVIENCIKCKYTDCVEVCPVDCFYEGPNFLVIHPDECIDCALCEPECPVDAIFSEDELPEDQQVFLELNAELAEVWPNITEMKEGLPDAEEWAGITERPADRSQYKEPDEVADAFLHFLTAENPKRRYMVVPNQGEADWTLTAKVRELVQLNADQPYTRDREALIEMLDEELARFAE